jgi:hypothetical protein
MKGTIGLSAVVMLAGGALATMSPKPHQCELLVLC